ncbi:hypothetical protein K9O30_22575 [Clostridium bowmanii]|nr:hypothetical protein [Clostridium bowmanii]
MLYFDNKFNQYLLSSSMPSST